jgi:hypothetical protein
VSRAAEIVPRSLTGRPARRRRLISSHTWREQSPRRIPWYCTRSGHTISLTQRSAHQAHAGMVSVVSWRDGSGSEQYSASATRAWTLLTSSAGRNGFIM